MREVTALQAELKTAMRAHGPGYLDTCEGQELREVVEQAIREIRRTPDFVDHTNRVFTLTAPRPKGVKGDIRTAVAREFSDKWGVKLRASYVQDCWDDFRAFEKE